MTDTPENPETGIDTTDSSPSRWPLIAGAVVIVAALVAALVFINNGDDDDSSDSVATSEASQTTDVSETTATTDVPETTQSPETSAATTTAPATTEAPPPSEDVSTAIWPWTDTDLRYADPVEAATGFATDYLGFVDPIAGEFMAGDDRSGEVEIRTFESGPSTVVFVRQLTADDSWWVLGAASENITIDEPDALAEVTSPLTVSGMAVAFEGTVDVQLRADGNGEPIFEGFVTASGGQEPGPYSETFDFTSPGQTSGALVMLSLSPEDGSTLEASALRIFYP
ncbi:MAG TPA: Gmad2 immunoglobulin-like domain-containing protein [Ilumatobacteraceae bacterium]|nr:Gmad2 immunoglobulin-like domain-containing protein [Ilumatobacteraceae bacterium]